ncbi:carbohydrate esterase family 1 protein [Coleophoma crateriformis]|uniref:feruloyl esterase n=1 Tax=Coleophoma crateriformis TaxID=565419 RepID=A0A3D8QIR0_9HELO|nr:carbohydrate esterase family 1 protein [Coleophoma crateriformis]
MRLLQGLAAVALACSHVEAHWPAPGCGLPSFINCQKPLPQGQKLGGIYNLSVLTSGLDRSYLISIPPCYTSRPATPVILSYHGGTRNASYQLELDKFTNPEFNRLAIVVYPQGLDNTWQGIPGASVKANDFQFTSDILDQIEQAYCIDRSRIWASGKSDGGGFCNQLACDPVLSKRIAAFAPVSGAFYVDTLPCNANTVSLPCNPGRPNIPLLDIHGGNDTTISYDGGARKNECLPAIPHFVQQWALRDHLSLDNRTTYITNDTRLYSYGDRNEAGLVSHILDESIGHDWPSTLPNADNTQVDHVLASYNATPIILGFFKRYPLF